VFAQLISAKDNDITSRCPVDFELMSQFFEIILTCCFLKLEWRLKKVTKKEDLVGCFGDFVPKKSI
jgi:hypothetical protein